MKMNLPNRLDTTFSLMTSSLVRTLRGFFFDSERVVNIAEDQSINEKIRLSNAFNQVLGVKNMRI